jgi:hypothetical protein
MLSSSSFIESDKLSNQMNGGTNVVGGIGDTINKPEIYPQETKTDEDYFKIVQKTHKETGEIVFDLVVVKSK